MTSLSLGLGIGGFVSAAGQAVALLDGSEADGTNLLTNAGDLDFSTWGALGCTVTPNNAVAPNGATAAARVLEDATTARHGVYKSGVFSITAGSSHVYSFYVKSITRRYFQLVVAGGGVSKVYAFFDLQSGAVSDSGTVSPSGGTAVSAVSIAAAVNGFYKCSATVIVDGTSTAPFFQAMMSDVSVYGAPLDANSPSFAGNTANGLYLWRPKVV